MKKYLFITLITLFCFCTGAWAQLNGNYTIDPSGSGTSNYTSFAAAISALSTSGVNGPVTFTVAAATYSNTASLSIPVITGASATNTITFDGGSGNAATRVVSCSFSTAASGVFQLAGADFIRFKNLTIRTTSTAWGWGIHFWSAADNNIVDSCIIDISAYTGTSQTQAAGIIFSGSTTSYSTGGNNGNRNIIRNSEIKGSATGGPYSGISLYGTNSSGFNKGNQFINNDILDFYVYGIFVQTGYDSTFFIKNRISRPNRPVNTFYGIQYNSNTANYTMEGNVITNPFGPSPTTTNQFMGISINSNVNGTLQKGAVIKNNLMYNINGQGQKYGIYDQSNYVSDSIYNNTISFDYTGTSQQPEYGIYASMGTFTPTYVKHIKNNIITMRTPSSSGVAHYGLYLADNMYVSSDNNVILVNGAGASNFTGYFNGSAFASLADFRGASTPSPIEMNSMSVDPGYTSSTNLTPTNCVINNRGVALASVATDINGNSRGASPDPGAYEFSGGGANDAAVTAVTSPSGNICSAGNQTVTVTIKNYGSSNLTGAAINWSVNGTAQTAGSYSGSLAPGATASVNLGTFNFSAGTIYNFTVKTASPNGATDACAGNDSIQFSRSVGLSGTYTINPSGSGSGNFTSFTSAVDALKIGGVCGAVTFNVSAATYNEQISIPAIVGASASNTITFNGGSASSRILQFAYGTVINYAIVDLNGADYITFRNITVKSASASYGFGFLLRGQANYNTIDSCIIDHSAVGATSNAIGICFSGSTSNYSVSGNHANFCNITNNQIIGSATGGTYIGISFYGSTSNNLENKKNVIANNIVQDFYYRGIYTYYYIDSLIIRGNDISRPNRNQSGTLAGIWEEYYMSNRIVENNRIHNMNGGFPTNTNTVYGMYAQQAYNLSYTARNNAIYDIQGVGPITGIYNYYNYASKWYHNTVSLDGNVANTNVMYGMYFYWASTGCEMRNNIYSVTRPGSGARYGMYIQDAPGTSQYVSDNNIYYVNGSGSLNYYGAYNSTTLYPSFDSWKNRNSSVEQNSLSLNPIFTNLTSNLTPTNCAANNTGAVISSVTTDILGNSRSSVLPDAGAYEFTAGGANDAGIVSVSGFPTSVTCSGTAAIVATIKNFGTANLTSANIRWSVNGTAQTAGSLGTTLSPGTSTTVSLGNVSLSAGTVYTIIVSTGSPNGGTDACGANDTTIYARGTGLSGTYTINPAGTGTSNYPSFTAAVNDLTARGVCGPVVLNVASGTYTEQVVIPQFNGVSASNTVTFKSASANPADVNLTFNNTNSATNWVVCMNGADYVNIRNIKVTALGANYATAISFRNVATRDSISGCILNSLNIASTSTNYATVFSSATYDSVNVFEGNTFNDGVFGIYFSGSSSSNRSFRTMILNNTFNNQYYMGVYINYGDKLRISGNLFNTTTSYTGSLYSIYNQNAYNDLVIEKNRVLYVPTGTSGTYYGIYNTTVTGTATDSALIANNEVIVSSAASAHSISGGIYLSNGTYTRIYNNSVLVHAGTGTTTYPAYITGGSNNRILNNVFVNRRTSTATSNLAYFRTNVATNYSDYNLLFCSGTYLAAITTGAGYTTLTAWQGSGNSPDLNSINRLPYFVNVNSLVFNEACLDNKGTNATLVAVPSDKAGTSRGSVPDVGAFELSGAAYDLHATVLTSPTSYSASPQTVTFRIRNNGSTAITAFDAGYNVNNGTVTTQTFSISSLAGCDSTTLSFSTGVTLPSSGLMSLKAFIRGNLNSSNADAARANDTVYSNQFCAGGLSGTYTINSALPPSNTNFQNFTAVATVLNSCGVSGPVTFNVAAGTYDEQFTLNAITGSSATNRITFNGGSGNAATRILQYNFITTGTAGYSLVHLNGTDYTTFKNLTVKSTSATLGWGFLLKNTADYNIIDSCIIDLGMVTSVTNGNAIGICMSANITGYNSSGNHANNCTFSNNWIKGSASGGPYYGFSIYSNTSSGSWNINNTISNNTIQDFYAMGIYTYYYVTNLSVKGNDISRPNRNSSTTTYGMYFQNYLNSSIIENNRIHNMCGGFPTNPQQIAGIYETSAAASPGNVIRNNAIYDIQGMGTLLGLYNTSSYYSKYYNNTVSLDGTVPTGSTLYGFYYQPSTGTTDYGQDVRNNIISVNRPGTGSGTRYGIYNGSNDLFKGDNNVYMVNSPSVGSNLYAYWAGATFSTFAAWKARITTAEQNSLNVDPQFVNLTSNLAPTNCALNNTGVTVSGVTTDITGAPRGAAPDPGAYEFTGGGANDIGITAVTAPAGTSCTAGSKTVTVTIKNFGTAALTSATINWTVNGSAQTPYSWTGSIGVGGTASANIGSLTYAAGDVFNVVVSGASPNGATDGCAANDTLKFTKGMGLSGVYTINPSGSGTSNFLNFTEAANALNNLGICGPVTFNVSAGTYVEQIALGSIPGSSSTSTITFNGGNASTSILQYNYPVASNYAIVHLNGSDYVTFKNLTLKSTSATYGWGFLLNNQANYNTIDSCVIDLGAVTNTSANNAIGICFSGSPNNYSTSGNHANYCTISNNRILGSASGGAYFGISTYNTNSTTECTDNKIINNTIQDFYNVGIYMGYYAYNMIIRGNDISRPNRTNSTTLYGIQCQSTYYLTLDGNKIHNMNGGFATNTNIVYGIWQSSIQTMGLTSNNAIYDIQGTGTHYGIFSQSNFYSKFYNNTVSFDHTTTPHNGIIYGIYSTYNTTSAQAIEFKNNLVSITRPGTGTRYGFFESYTYFGYTSDYNNYYVNSSGAVNYIGSFNGNALPTLALYKNTFSPQEQNSMIWNPIFNNVVSDVTPTNCGFNDKGISLLTTDITGATRGTPSDLGAYEFSAASGLNASISSFVSPGVVVCSGSQNVIVKLKNAGTVTITSATIGWDVSGSAQTPYSWTGSLAPGAETNVTLGTYNFPATTPFSVRAFTSAPNGGTDVCNNNDSLATPNALPALNGVYTINPSGSGVTNFTTFALATTALIQRGVCGPVVFNISAGTYVEQVVVPYIMGSSASSPITFNGGTGNAATRIIQYNGPVGVNYSAFWLNGADYVTLKNVTLRSNYTSNSSGVQFSGAADYNTIDSCIIDLSVVTLTSNGSAGINFTSAPNTWTGTGNHGNYNTIRGNEIKGGVSGGPYHGINFYAQVQGGNMGNRFIGNIITDFYANGIYLYYYLTNTTVTDNQISRPVRNTSLATVYGIYSTYSMGGSSIQRNRIFNPFGGMTTSANTYVALYDNYAPYGGPLSTIANNLLYNFTGTGPHTGIYVFYDHHMKVYNNTIYMDNTTASSNVSYGIWTGSLYTQGTPAPEIKNNIVHITRAGSGAKYALYMTDNNNTPATPPQISHNNYYVTGSGAYIAYNPTYGTHTTLASWQSGAAALSFDVNSTNLNPSFANPGAGDFTPTNSSMNNKGTPVTAFLPDDINGLPRSITAPDQGVIEWGPACAGTPTVAGVTINSGGMAVCGTSVTLTAQYDVVTGLSFQWQSSTTGTGGWGNIGGATNFKYVTPPVSGALYYRCGVTCGGNTAYTGGVLVMPGMSGVYTINASGSGTTNFTTFNNAITAMNTFGVCGPVTINVASGTYTERMTITQVAGASSVNTITFDGGTGNASSRTIEYNNSSTDYSIVELNGADYFRFKNLTVKSLSANYAYGFLIRGVADYNIIDSCVVDLSSITVASTTGNGIVFSASNINYSTSGNHGNYNIIRNNTVKGSATGGPYMAISMYCEATSAPVGNYGNQFINNDLTDFYQAGLYIYYAHKFTQISGNRISRPTRAVSSTVYGIYLYYYFDGCVIENNKVFNPYGGGSLTGTFYGIYAATSQDRSNLFRNNMVYNSTNTSGANYGFYLSATFNNRYYHNTVAFNDAAAGTVTNHGFWISGSTGSYSMDLKNNIISITRPVNTGYVNYGLYVNSVMTYTSDNNLYYINGAPSNFVVYNNGSTHNELSTWQAGGQDLNSFSSNPLFANYPSNLTPGCVINAKGANVLSYVPSDFAGNARGSLPDPGAFEINSGSSDAALMGVVSPSSNGIICSSSPQDVVVKLVNTGSDTLKTVTIEWRVNGNTQTPYSWTGTLLTGQSANVTLGSFNFSSAPQNIFLINTRLPNGAADGCMANDTVSNYKKAAGLSGTYTIDANSSGNRNFLSFGDAASALSQNGVCGPVIFNAAPGTYVGRFSISAYPGASATNTVTFDGGNANDVTVSESFATPTNYSVIHLNGADYVTIKNITVKSNSTSYGWGFLLNNQANYNTITNCKVDVGINTTTTNCIGICMSASSTTYSATGDHANYCTFSNNTIIGGYAGIWFYGQTTATMNMNNVIINNTILDNYYAGIVSYYYMTNMQIKGNNISRPNRTSFTTYYGIYDYYAQNHLVEGNIIHNPFAGSITNTNTFYGIYAGYNPSSAGGTLVRNNIIRDVKSLGPQYGIYCSQAYYSAIDHNTIILDHTVASSATSYGIRTENTVGLSYPQHSFRNNIVYMTQPATSTTYYRTGVDIQNGSSSTNIYNINSNGNVFYINGAGATNAYGQFNPAATTPAIYFTTLASWQTTGHDANSIVADPQFTSATNQIPTNPAVNGTGVLPLAFPLTTDFNGKTRSTTFPDAGAFDWTPICAGTDLSQGTPFQGTMRNGTFDDFDHLKGGDTITFDLSPITGYSNASYGSAWTIDSYSFNDVASGAPVNSAMAGWVNPSVSGNGKFQFRPATAQTDSTYRLVFNVKNLTGNECMTEFTRYIYVAPVPVSDFDTTGGCFTTPLLIKNNSTLLRGSMSFDWNFGDTVDNTSIQGTATHNFSHPGVFTVTLTTTSELGYSNTVVKNIRVSYLPVALYKFTSVCNNGDSVPFTNQSTIPGTPVPLNYRWDFGDNTISTLTNPNKKYAAIGTYPVTLTTTSDFGCEASYTRNVFVFPVPVAAFTATNPCQGANATFTNGTTIDYGTIGYEWSFGDGSTDIVASPVKMYVNQGTYNVKMIAYSEYGCKDSVIKQVTIGTNPTANFSLTKACLNDSAEFTNSSTTNGGPALNYSWDFGDLGSSTNAGSKVNHLYGASGAYTVKLTVNNGACTHSTSKSVNILSNPVANFVASGGICQGNTTSFSNLSTGNGTLSYDWNFGAGTSTDKDPAYSFPGAGTFNVVLKVTSSNGCDNSTNKNVSVFPQPAAAFTANWNNPQPLRQVSFTPGLINLYAYKWDFGDGNISQQVAPVYSYFSNGPFNVKLRVTDINGCYNEKDTIVDFRSLSTGAGLSKQFSFEVYPNPFRSSTNISYELPKSGSVEVKVFDITGRELTTLVNQTQDAGKYKVNFDPSALNLKSGIYFIRLSVDGNMQNKQVIEIR